MDRWKSEMGRAREKRKVKERRAEERRSEKRKSQKKEDAGARKVAKHCVFPMICGSGGSKSRLAKAAGAEPSGQMRDEKLQAVVTRSTFASEEAKNTSRSNTFASWNVEKVHAVAPQSTFRSQMLKTPHVRTLLEVEMSKKCTLLWREAHFQVKMLKKTPGVRNTLGSWDV